MDRLFTLEEARALLPRLKRAGQRLRERKRLFEQHRMALQVLSATVQGGEAHLNPALERHRRAAEELAAELESLLGGVSDLGVECKGIEQGLFDFRSERDGRIVYLCWQVDEPDIGWWHDLETGFASRRPLT